MARQQNTAARIPLAASLGGAGLGLLLLGCAGASSGKHWPADKPPTEAENRAAAKSAKPVLDAIYRFKQQNGLWPNDLSELVPEYMQKDQLAGWRYSTRHDGYWTLINYAGFPNSAVQFRHLKDEGGHWEVSWGDEQTDLDVPYAPPAVGKPPVEEVIKKMRETVLRRIEQNPMQVIHHKGLISALYRKGQFKEAKQACLVCLEKWPDLWWPNVVLSLIDVQLGGAKEAEARLLPWVKKHGTFHHWFFAAHFYHAAGAGRRRWQPSGWRHNRPLKRFG